MKNYGKKITLFLIDGVPNGRITCELSNWTGKAYKIPRIYLSDSSKREELKKPGVYLLFGKDEANNDKVYIGEAEVIYDRLKQHLSQKDFWNETIAFISKDENLNKAHIKYLESRLFGIAKNVKRYKIENGATPTMSAISEADKAEMEEFIENIKMLTNTLGHKVFEEITEQLNKKAKKIFEINAARGAKAKGIATSAGFVVLKGSQIALSTVPSYPKPFEQIRNNLINRGTLKRENEKLILTEDYEFSSPSTAASIVMGRNANGLTEWKFKDGTTLKDFESRNDK
ncbi:GIY-YIG nuclease family protein [Thermophagus xiamenensis]|jgi:hypothetical protein|uniref:GIY-YIG catalytic domain-containing protein n=1 Tax=Thermophagus xiamenensis TaxID=385682 RepID=A0A1I1VT80_9BACT|nr:GIY-YIG nuclease family protein [Thermophagus xiamenensis]SFD85939.1 GIY-YIG catalytic domain-containing protein [Thermophagus xiamenensis]